MDTISFECKCVQEWDGDTADSAFAADLARGFELVRRIALPPWPDTAHDLTLWRRRGGGGSGAVTVAEGASAAPQASVPAGDGVRRAETASGSVPPSLESCSACFGAYKGRPAAAGAVAGSVVAGGPLRRCRLCREVQYCCTACAELHRQAHAGIHALRLIWGKGQGGAPRGASDGARGGNEISALGGAEYEDFHPFGLR